MPLHVRLILIAAWVAWLIAWLMRFGVTWPKTRTPEKRDTRARWGMLLGAAGFFVLYLRNLSAPAPGLWRVGLAIAFFAVGSGLVWTALRALGRYWRVDAGLDADHQLVRAGPYRFVRHPIYASVLCMMLGLGLLVATWPMLFLGMALGIAGTEIRVRIEDALLASRFGEEFRAYQRAVPAYIPFLH